jgi:hypothetical protein
VTIMLKALKTRNYLLSENIGKTFLNYSFLHNIIQRYYAKAFKKGQLYSKSISCIVCLFVIPRLLRLKCLGLIRRMELY